MELGTVGIDIWGKIGALSGPELLLSLGVRRTSEDGLTKPGGLPGVDRGSGRTLDRGVCLPPFRRSRACAIHQWPFEQRLGARLRDREHCLGALRRLVLCRACAPWASVGS